MKSLSVNFVNAIDKALVQRPTQMQEQRSQINTPFPLDSLIIKPDNHHDKTPVYLLLHGFGQRAKRLYRQWGQLFNPNDCLVIPNAPFPMPKKKTDSKTGKDYYQIPRAWYFYNNLKDEFLIDYEFPSELLARFIQDIGLVDNPLCIIGYSQGGYLAPFVATKLTQTKHVIGINCRYREDLLPAKLRFRLDAFHAQKDTQVDYKKSFTSFELLKSRSLAGEFYTWPEKDHELDEQTNAQLMAHIKDYRDLLV